MKNNKSPWKKLSSKIVYRNPWISIQEDKVIKPSGQLGIYTYVNRCNSVIIVPLTDKKEVYLVRQWRYPMEKETIELPWGGVDKGETLLRAAKRELKEETGLTANKWVNLGKVDVLGSYGNEIAYIYLAKELKSAENNLEDTENIKLIKIPFQTAYLWCLKEKINSSSCIAAILRAKHYLKV